MPIFSKTSPGAGYTRLSPGIYQKTQGAQPPMPRSSDPRPMGMPQTIPGLKSHAGGLGVAHFSNASTGGTPMPRVDTSGGMPMPDQMVGQSQPNMASQYNPRDFGAFYTPTNNFGFGAPRGGFLGGYMPKQEPQMGRPQVAQDAMNAMIRR